MTDAPALIQRCLEQTEAAPDAAAMLADEMRKDDEALRALAHWAIEKELGRRWRR